MNTFKVDDKIIWNGNTETILPFDMEAIWFLKSKKVHNIRKVEANGLYCRLDDSMHVFDPNWFDLAKEGEYEKQNNEIETHDVKKGSKVKWNGRIDDSFSFREEKKEFLKSKFIHTIDYVDYDENECQLLGSDDMFKLYQFELIDEEIEIPSFSVGFKVNYNGEKYNTYSALNDEKYNFLKSKDVHIISYVDLKYEVCLLMGSCHWYDLSWFNIDWIFFLQYQKRCLESKIKENFYLESEIIKTKNKIKKIEQSIIVFREQ